MSDADSEDDGGYPKRGEEWAGQDRGQTRARLERLSFIHAIGVPEDLELRKLLADSSLSLTEIQALESLYRRALEPKLGAPKRLTPLQKADRRIIIELEHLGGAGRRPLSWKEIDSIAHTAAGCAKIETKRDRLWDTYQLMLKEREQAAELFTGDN